MQKISILDVWLSSKYAPVASLSSYKVIFLEFSKHFISRATVDDFL